MGQGRVEDEVRGNEPDLMGGHGKNSSLCLERNSKPL